MKSRLTFIKDAPRRKNKVRAIYQCSCGNIKEMNVYSVINNVVVSCGCLQKEINRKRLKTHGLSKTSEHGIWRMMFQRTTNPNHQEYINYGGRGIFVCEEWKDFNVFIKDMGKRPSLKYSIERIDNSLGYCKTNCRWATAKEQQNNKRNNHIITLNGKTQTLTQWSEELNISLSGLWGRVKRGWNDTDILSVSTIKTKPKIIK